jgi:poly-gamma-glutamate synthesis protein (capsule biosynthesis protein)
MARGGLTRKKAESGRTWSLTAVGDAIIGHRTRHLDRPEDPGFHELCKLIRSVDIASVNLETNVFDMATFTGSPGAERGGSYLIAPPVAVDDLAAMGFHLFARGNNHAGDWGIEGLRATTRVMDERGLPHSGCGENLAAAGRAVYLDTTVGRVAMLSLTTTFPASHRAGAQRGDVMGRPGVNGVRVKRKLELEPATYKALAATQAAQGNPRLFENANLPLAEGTENRIVEWLDPRDVDRVLREVRNAAAFADIVLVNGHTHEPANKVLPPPEWLVTLARACIDAGATAYLGHGPHQLRGMEIHAGRPIFYSLGNFIFHRDATEPVPADQYEVLNLPADTAMPVDYYTARAGQTHSLNFADQAYYETVLPLMQFEGGRLAGLTFHAVELAQGDPPGRRGTPRLADKATGERIVKRLAELSEPFGCKIVWKGGIGIWRP